MTREQTAALEWAISELNEIGVLGSELRHLDELCRLRAALSAPKAEAHPDDKAVDRFAEAMKIKLAQKRKEGRGGWWDDAYCSNSELSAMLREHVEKGDPLDVGNLAMMLHQRGERIAPAPKAEAKDYPAALFRRAQDTAARAAARFPQPNYVTLKIAEEAGEVVRGAVHYAEERMEWIEVEEEIVQLMAMLIRFVTEGDLVNGVTPPNCDELPSNGGTHG